MLTQIFNDNSARLFENAKRDNKEEQKLDMIIEELKQLTEPKQISEMVNKLVEMRILNENDLITLKAKGISIEPKQDLAQEQEEPKQEIEKQEEELNLDENDDGR